MSTINPGDEVIIPAPYWVSYPDIVAFAGGKSIFVECDENSNFKITAEQLSQNINEKTITRALIGDLTHRVVVG